MRELRVRHERELSAGQVVFWTTLGLGTGLVAAFVLSEWVGGVSGPRVRRMARRFREEEPARLTRNASVLAVEAALKAEPRLAGLPLEAIAIRRGVVELRGWVPSRAARSLACRTALAAPGIESVINSVLVRGEDDQAIADDSHASDQSA